MIEVDNKDRGVFHFGTISSMSDDELEMEMSLFNKWYMYNVDDGTNTYTHMTQESWTKYRVYEKYIRYVLYEYEKRKYSLKMYHYLYSQPTPPGCSFVRGGRKLIGNSCEDGDYADDYDYSAEVILIDEFRKKCMTGELTDNNCQAHYAIKRDNDWYIIYDIHCCPYAFQLSMERTDFSYIQYRTK